MRIDAIGVPRQRRTLRNESSHRGDSHHRRTMAMQRARPTRMTPLR